MAPLRLISLHLLLGWIALIVHADFYDEPGGKTTTLGFSHEPADVVVARGQSARLDCLVRHHLPTTGAAPVDRNGSHSPSSTKHLVEEPTFDILWFQDGLLVPLPDTRRHLLANGSLYFDKVLHKRSGRASSDEGVYHCLAQQATGGGAFVSRNASVQVAVLAREFTTSPDNVTAQVGDSVRFSCEIESVPDASITWEKDGVAISAINQDDDDDIQSRFVVLNSGVLHIHDVQSDDAGNYRCVARNELADKDRKSQIGRLVVVVESSAIAQPPKFNTAPSSDPVWVNQGDNVTIECLATANAIIRWTINATQLLTNSRRGYLPLSDVDPSAAGDYTCLASVGNATVAQSTAVHVATVPEFVRVPKSQVFPTAKTVRFECEVTGTPKPDIRWFKDGRLIQIGGRIKNRLHYGGTSSELVLSNTVTQDSGIYQCQAQNRAGVVSVTARLLVNVSEGTRPEPPSNLKATPLSPTIALLTWDPPRNVPVDDVKAYTVHYMPLSGGASVNEETQEVSINNSYRIENLKRNANYSFYVRAYVRKSASDPSEKLIYSPSNDAPVLPRPPPRTLPPTAPNVTLLPLSPNTLRVSWRKFTTSSAAVAFYKIQYRRHRAKEFDIEVVKGDIHEYTITGLHPGRKYDVRIIPGSLNVAGQWYTVEMPRTVANATGTTTTTTGPVASSHPAPAVELVAYNATSVLVIWEDIGPSSGRQSAKNVHLTYRIQGGRDTNPAVILPASGSQWINGLKAGTVYEFQLTSGDDETPADGPTTVSIIRTLWDSGIEHEEEDTDSEPRSIRMDTQVLSSSSIQVSWYPLPPESLANILYYTIRYVIVPESSSSSTPVQQFIRSTGYQVKLTGLNAYALYRISVRVHDRQGRSSTYSSPAAEARTLADLPGPPHDLSYVAIDGSIHLSWKPPNQPNGNILGYAVLFSSDPQAPIDTWTKQEESGIWQRSVLRDLHPGTVYYVRVQARTSIGWGPSSASLLCQFQPSVMPSDTSSTIDYDPGHFRDQYLGAFIGLAVSFGLAIACSVSLLLRARCIKRMSSERNSPATVASTEVPVRQPANGTAATVCNGNGILHRPKQEPLLRRNGFLGGGNRRPDPHQQQPMEMDVFVPMLATIPVAEETCHHLDTKGGYGSSRGSHHKEDSSLCNGSLRRADQEADTSELPLLSPVADSTILSHATETTCLSLDYSGRNRRRRRLQPASQGSLHSHDSSLHSLDSRSNSSSDNSSSRSLRGQDDNDTGICHADHQMNDSGLVVAVVSSNNNRSKGSQELVIS